MDNELKETRIMSGGFSTRRLAADAAYVADGVGNPKVIGFYAPDPNTTFTVCDDRDNNSLIAKMGLGVPLSIIGAPVEHFETAIYKITANKPIVLLLEKYV